MSGFFPWLFDRSMGPPGPSGHWPLWLTLLFHTSNFAIAAADMAVPAVILANWMYRRDGISRRAFWTVALYFPAKSLSRLARVAEFSGPTYHLTAILDTLTAVLAVYSTAQLGPFLRHLLKLPSRAQIHDLANRLQAEISRKDLTYLKVKAQHDAIADELRAAREIIANKVWIADRQAALDRLDAITRLLKEDAENGRH